MPMMRFRVSNRPRQTVRLCRKVERSASYRGSDETVWNVECYDDMNNVGQAVKGVHRKFAALLLIWCLSVDSNAKF